MKALSTLERLAGQAVDRERQVLQAIADEIAEVERQLRYLRQSIADETSRQLDVMTTGVTLSAFVEASNRRMLALDHRRHQLVAAYDAQAERVKQERIEEKRFQLLAERRAKQMASEAALREQKAIDELAATGHARRRTKT